VSSQGRFHLFRITIDDPDLDPYQSKIPGDQSHRSPIQ
jgi:hypothetical protein